MGPGPTARSAMTEDEFLDAVDRIVDAFGTEAAALALADAIEVGQAAIERLRTEVSMMRRELGDAERN